MASRVFALLLCLALSVPSLCAAQTSTTTTVTATSTSTSTTVTATATTTVTTPATTTVTSTATTTVTSTATTTSAANVSTSTAMANGTTASETNESSAVSTTVLPATKITGEMTISLNDTEASKFLNDTDGKMASSLARGLATKFGINASYITVSVSATRRLSLRRLATTLKITYEINIPAGESSAGVVSALTEARSSASKLAELQDAIVAEVAKEVPGISFTITEVSEPKTETSTTGKPVESSGMKASACLSLVVLGLTMVCRV